MHQVPSGDYGPFERVPDTFGTFRWDGPRRKIRLPQKMAKSLVKDLMRASKDEAVSLAYELSRSGVPVSPKTIRPMLASREGRRSYRFILGQPELDEWDGSVRGIAEEADVRVDTHTGEVTWTARIEGGERSRSRHNARYSGSWAGKALYEWAAASQVRDAG